MSDGKGNGSSYGRWRFRLFCMLVLSMVLLLDRSARAEMIVTDGGVRSNNEHAHEYEWGWAVQPYSYLYQTASGGYCRVEALSDQVIVEAYSADFILGEKKAIDFELPIFGGFYHGTKYNYLVYGANNTQETDETEIMRVVKYDTDWKRLDSTSYYGCNTREPFDAGNVSFTECENILYIRTCHTMYKRTDGLNHQASMTYAIAQDDLRHVDEFYGIMNIDVGYVSHSFNQIIRIADGHATAVDHGDAWPRAVVLGRYVTSASEGEVYDYQSVNLYEMPGNVGDNYTGVNVGGFEVSSTHCIVAINSVDLSGLYSNCVKNVLLLVQPINSFDPDATVVKEITSYEETGDVSASNPYLVPLENDQFALIWEETSRPEYAYTSARPEFLNRVKIMVVDHEGNQIGTVREVKATLSDCAPICRDGKLIWYVTNGERPRFYVINLREPEPELFDVYGANVNLGNELAMNFYIEKKNIDPEKKYYVRLIKINADDRANEMRVIPSDKWSNYDERLYKIVYKGIAAKEMCDSILVQVFHEDGTPASALWEDSIADYSGRVYASMNDSARLVIADMLNYGRTAQDVFDYNKNKNPMGKLPSGMRIKTTNSVRNADISVAGENYVGSNLNLGNSLSLNLYFNNVKPDGYAILTYSNYQNRAFTLRIDGSKFIPGKGGTYAVRVNTLAVADVTTAVTCKVYDKQGNEVGSCVDSIQSYLKRSDGAGGIGFNILAFGSSSYQYFNQE